MDIGLLDDLFAVKMYWKKIEPLMKDLRKDLEEPKLFENFEYLCNEITKHREKRTQSAKIR